jgi:biotin carboxyl carrier protein
MNKDTKAKQKPGKVLPVMEENTADCRNKKMRCKTLIIHGEKYRTTYTRKFENRKVWAEPNHKHILSYIPGTVNEIYVKEGQKVKKGEKMLLLEAMKMLNTIEVKADGKIKKLNIKTGDRIPKGFLMIEFE